MGGMFDIGGGSGGVYKDGTLAYKSDGFIDGGEWFIEDPMAVIKQPGDGI